MINENISSVNQSYASYKERLTNIGSDFELGLFLFILRKNIKWIFIVFAVAMVLSFLYLRYNAPIYEASTVIQLSKSDKARQILQVNQIYDEQSLTAEVELLKSNLLLQESVKRLPLEISYFHQGEFLTKQLYRVPDPKVKLLEVRDSSIIDRQVFIQPIGNGRFVLEYKKSQISDPFRSNDIVVTPYFEAQIQIGNDYNSEEMSSVQVYFVINSAKQLAAYFRRSMEIRILNPVAKTISISCKDHNPRMAYDFVMAHAYQYLDYDQNERERSALNIIDFIDEQIVEVYEVLRKTEFDLNQFLKANRITDPNRISQVYLSYFQEYDDKLVEIEFEEQLLKEVENITDDDLTEMDVYSIIPVLSGTHFESLLGELLTQLRDLLTKKERLLFEVKSNHDGIKSIEYQIDIQKKLISETIDASRTRLSNKKELLLSKFNQYEDSFYSLPEKELEYARLQRHFKINEKYYMLLLEKQTEYRISKAGFVPENRILEEARVPTFHIAPNRTMILAFASFISLIISLLLLLAKYLTHNDLTSLHEISKLSHASIGILGMTPRYKTDIPVSQMVVDKNPKSLIAESFRTIRTNLQFLNTDGDSPKLIAITSTVSGEGKTFIAINLAGIIAFSGKKVILLDLDMRKPRIHEGFGVNNSKGMSTLLVGKDTIENCVHQSNLDNLDFITAGPVPPNPSELILNKKTDEIIENLKKSYDVIIIDNPPVGMVTDGISIIQKADYPIYVFRSDYSKKHYVQNVDRLINENGITKMSVILNSVDIDRHKYGYNYGYGYGYGYGKAYGYYEEPEDKSVKNKFKFWK